MPTLTRIFIKTALASLVVGMSLSTLSLINGIWHLHPLLTVLPPTALHLIVVGALTQLIFGVALWMFPPWLPHQLRGPALAGWSCYGLLNFGLGLRVLAEPLNSWHPDWGLGPLLVGAAWPQVSAVGLFVLLVWPRVRAKPIRK